MLVGVPDSPCKPPRRPQCAYTQLLRLKPCTAPRPQALTKPSAAFEMPAVHSTLRVPHRLRHTQPAPGSGPSSRRRLAGKLPPPDRTTRFRAAVQAQAHARECAGETVGVTLQRLNNLAPMMHSVCIRNLMIPPCYCESTTLNIPSTRKQT